jgi:hypothetical protein
MSTEKTIVLENAKELAITNKQAVSSNNDANNPYRFFTFNGQPPTENKTIYEQLAYYVRNVGYYYDDLLAYDTQAANAAKNAK